MEVTDQKKYRRVIFLKLYLDPGHGGSDPGAVGNGLKEKDLTLAISKKIRDFLQGEYEGVTIKMSRTGDTFPSLVARSNDANKWGADFFLSVHINAGGGTGFETFIYTSTSSKTKTYQNTIHPEILKFSDLKDRGKKKGNLSVLRNTDMPAILTECGFIDSASDSKKMKDNAWIAQIARGHVNGIAKAFSLKKKAGVPAKTPPKTTNTTSTTTQGKLYKVQTGAFRDRENAEKQLKEVQKYFKDAFINES